MLSLFLNMWLQNKWQRSRKKIKLQAGISASHSWWEAKNISYSQNKIKAVKKYLLQFDRLIIKKGVLHRLYINNNVEYHQMVLPIKFQAQVLQLLHDGQGHQGTERTIALCWEWFYWNTMFQDATKYVERLSMMPDSKGRLHQAKHNTRCYNS